MKVFVSILFFAAVVMMSSARSGHDPRRGDKTGDTAADEEIDARFSLPCIFDIQCQTDGCNGHCDHLFGHCICEYHRCGTLWDCQKQGCAGPCVAGQCLYCPSRRSDNTQE